LLTTVAPAVAKAAMDSGVSKFPITDWDAYKMQLSKRLGLDNTLTRAIINKARQNPKRIVFADAENPMVLKAAREVIEEGIAKPILLGNVERINQLILENQLNLNNPVIIDPKIPQSESEANLLLEYADRLFEKRQRKGTNKSEAHDLIKRRNYYGAMMVELGAADAMIGGMTRNYPETVRPALQIVGRKEGIKKVSGMYILMSRFGPLFLADTTVNFNPSVEEIVEIAELAADQVTKFNIKPRLALLSYSNFGTADGDDPEKMRRAVQILKARHPEMIVDGEMQAHLPFHQDLLKNNHPFCSLADGNGANILIFSNLSASNIAYNLVKEIAGIEKIGPILMGLKHPVNVLQLGSSTREIVNMVAISALGAG